MKYFLLLFLISFAGWRTAYSQTAPKATQVITLRLMPVHVIELPAAASQNEKAQANAHSALPQTTGKWFTNKEILASNDKQTTFFTNGNTPNTPAAGAYNKPRIASPVVYTVTNL